MKTLTPHCVVFCHCGPATAVSPGQSRGFGFVEFNHLQEASRWMETNQVTSHCTHTYTLKDHTCMDVYALYSWIPYNFTNFAIS